MRNYIIKFIGRKVGAIGVTHACKLEVWAANERHAVLRVYETHEHLSQVSVNGKPFELSNLYANEKED